MEAKTYKNWWFLALNGLIAILLGIILMFFTEEAIRQIVWFFGLFVVVIGIILLISGIYQVKKDKGATLLMLQSIASIVIGLCIMIFPKNSLQLFMILIGVWAIIVGIFQLVVLVNVRKELSHKNTILLNGLFTIVLGIVFLFDPFTIFKTVEWVIRILGGLAVLFGIVLIYVSFTVRKIRPQEVKKAEEPQKVQ